MPELPEVETIKRGLEGKIVGLEITNTLVLNPKTFQGNPEKLRGKKVLKIWRRAKILGIDLGDGNPSFLRKRESGYIDPPIELEDDMVGELEDDRVEELGGDKVEELGWDEVEELERDNEDGLEDDKGLERDKKEVTEGQITLLIHLKMSGQLIWVGVKAGKKKSFESAQDRLIGGHPTSDWTGQMPNASTRVIFEFSDGSDLYFNDQRKFGWVKVVSSKGQVVRDLLRNLGPEPLEEKFTWQVMKERVGKHPNWAIKVAIMDQQAIAGVGNIYANEACFNAKIDPKRRVSSMTEEDWQTLYDGLIKALEGGLKHGGSSRAHFVNADGERGMFLDFANVYQKQGTPCKVCGTEIIKITLGGRGTYYCSKCQK